MFPRLLLIVVVAVLISNCTFTPKKRDSKQANTKIDSFQIIQKPYEGSVDLIEYEITVIRGTSIKHGVQKRFYRNGSLYSEIPYIAGRREGTAYTYYQAAEGAKSLVWKEQPYKKNKLDGICKRYHNNGILQAEYEYKEGFPGLGIKEFTKTGKAIVQPALIVSANRVATGYYVSARLSKKADNVDFFMGELVEGKYFPKNLKAMQVKNGLGEIIVGPTQKSVTISAVFYTRYRNRCVVSKTIGLQ